LNRVGDAIVGAGRDDLPIAAGGLDDAFASCLEMLGEAISNGFRRFGAAESVGGHCVTIDL
jgi:hypothetical protein